MYSGFIGTVLSHFLSLISTLWAIFKVHRCSFESDELQCIRLGLFLVAANSSLSMVRYGMPFIKSRIVSLVIIEISQRKKFFELPSFTLIISLKYFCFTVYLSKSKVSLFRVVVLGSVDGYKLRRLHIISLNFCAISYFTISEAVLLLIYKSPAILLGFPALNIIPLVSNVLAKDYRTKYKYSDVIIAINCLFFLIVSFYYENYYSSAFSASYFFGYFFIGESGYFLDTEVPSIDAFQYLTCFLNVFAALMFCY